MKRKLMGILAVGRTKTQAVNNYKLLALGKGATVVVDEGGSSAFVAQASNAATLFNPLNGEMNFAQRPGLMGSLQFHSESSDVKVDVAVAHCADGCGAYVISESKEVLVRCPCCTHELSMCADEDEEDLEAADDTTSGDTDTSGDGEDAEDDELTGGDDAPEEDAEDDEVDGDIAASSARPNRPRRNFASLSAVDSGDDDEDAEDVDAPAEDEEDVPASGDEVSADEDAPAEDEGEEDAPAEPLVVVSSSMHEAAALFASNIKAGGISQSCEGSNITAHYLVCECGEHHVVASEEIAVCPECQGKLREPEDHEIAVASESKVVDVADDLSKAVLVQASEEDPDEPSSDDVSGDEGTDADSGDAADDDAAAEDVSADPEVSESADGEDEDAEAEDEEANGLSVLGDEEDADIGEADIAPLDDVADDEDAENLDTSLCSVAGDEAWTAFVNGVPVAMARKAECSADKADIFGTKVFGQALLATAAEVGIKKALHELGFKPITHTVSVAGHIERRVKKAVAARMESLSNEQKTYVERLQNALATAAIGLNRGMFKGQGAPLKEALFNSLSSAGIRNPEVLIDSAFKAAHDANLKQMFAVASDILSKPEEVQESLSSTVLGFEYQSVSSEQEGPEVGGIESRLASMGQTVSVSAEHRETPPESSSSGKSKAARAAVLSSLGTFGRGNRR